jgi:hypothetical protein
MIGAQDVAPAGAALASPAGVELKF